MTCLMHRRSKDAKKSVGKFADVSQNIMPYDLPCTVFYVRLPYLSKDAISYKYWLYNQ